PAITAGSAPGLTFEYFTTAAATTAVGNPSAISVAGTYYVVGTTAGGCVTDTMPVIVTIDPLPIATINYPGSPFCKETGTISVVRTGQAGGTYTATPVGVVIDANTGAVDLTGSTEGTYTITYSFTNGTCPNTTTTTIVIDTPPTVTITDPARVCEPLTVDITAPAVTAGSTAGITFQYYTDAAGTITLANPSAIAISGTYYIRSTNANGCVSDLEPVVVIIDPLPVATISYPGSPFCAATGTVPVTHTGTTGGTYTVSPAGLTINGTTGQINPGTSTPGTYTVTYSFTNGTCPNTTTTTVTIEPTPTMVVTDPSPVCAPLTIDLTSASVTTGSTPGLNYTYFTDAAGTTSLANPSSVATSGTYYIQGTTPGGCKTPVQAVNVVVNPLPVATISYAGPYCVAIPTTANVTRTGQAGGTYSAPAGLSLNGTTGAIDVASSTPGTYTVIYNFTNGTCPSTTTTTVTIEAVPVLVVNTPAAVCEPATVDLTATSVTAGSTAGLTYSYYSDAAGTIAIAAPSAINASGVYYIRGALPGGCETSVLPVLVVVNDQPVLTAGNDTIVCRYDSLTLFASSAGNTIAWLNQPAGDDIVVRPGASTQYIVTATSPLGCVARDTVNVQVRSFSVTLAADKMNAPIGSTVLLTTLSAQSYSVIAWMPLQYLPNQTSPTQSYVMSDSAKLFTVVARSTEGCLDTASVMIQVDHDLKDFFIPNAMTPNGDGKNDVFRVYGSSIKAVDIRIYNSWGELIYQTNDNQKGWDGTYKGKKQPAGVYIYTVKATMYNDVILNRKGNINLLR
ncbi:MAG: gliding motility-associated C-terminal domain-containing protein, partial [Pedobacter sp.]